jgi:predicted metalloprotease with PDZ domain
MMTESAMAENHQPARFAAFVLWSTAFIFFMTPHLSAQQAADPVRYIVSFPTPQTHYAEIQADFPTGGQPWIEIFMPVWTPGSYLIREYARNVEDVRGPGAVTGSTVRKTRKNRWRIDTGGAATVRVTYRVYCREMSVRTNWVEDSFALLNGAPTFMTLVGGLARPHEVTLDLPAAWKTAVSGMDEIPGVAPHSFRAPDYDTLVDSPILAGNPAIYRFDVDGIPHYLVNEGEGGVWDGPRSAADLEKIVRRYREMWGGLPYRKKYVFLNLLTESGGGLEHRNSFTVMASRWATRTRHTYVGWLDVASHEYFHAWNIKRLRPAELGPFDYENENPTTSLWIVEGFTDYYGALTVHRTGLTSRAEYLGTGTDTAGSLSGLINSLQNTPGRLVQSAEQASFDAWIKLYRPDENTNNVAISYYTKGAVVAWLLDAKIRRATNDAKSLDDLMRLAYQRYSGERGFTPEQFKATAQEVAGVPLAAFFHDTVETPGELDYRDALDWFGLRFKAPEPPKDGTPKKAWMGVETRIDNGRLLISRVPRGTPAFDADLNVDDEIVAIGDYRVRADQLTAHLDNYKPGDHVSILVARRDKLTTLNLTFGETPGTWQLELKPDATGAQKRHVDDWLGKPEK